MFVMILIANNKLCGEDGEIDQMESNIVKEAFLMEIMERSKMTRKVCV